MYHRQRQRTSSFPSPTPHHSLLFLFSSFQVSFLPYLPLSNLPQNKRQSHRLILRHIRQMGQGIQAGTTKRISKIAIRFQNTRIARERLIAPTRKEPVLETCSHVEGLLVDHVAGISHLFEAIVRYHGCRLWEENSDRRREAAEKVNRRGRRYVP